MSRVLPVLLLGAAVVAPVAGVAGTWGPPPADSSLLPRPILGPQGVVHLGPLPPPEEGWGGRTLAVVVDPRSGGLRVVSRDLEIPGEPVDLSVVRVWSGDAWHWTGHPALREDDGVLRLTLPNLGEVRFGDAAPLEAPLAPGSVVAGAAGEARRTDDGFQVDFAGGERAEFDLQGLPLRWETGAGEVRFVASADGTWSIRASDGREVTASVPRLSSGGRRVWSVGGPGGTGCRYEEEGGRLVAVEPDDGPRQRYFYDASDRLRTILWPDGARTSVEYDRAGRVVVLAGPGASRWTFTWGERGLLAFSDPQGRRWSTDLGASAEIVAAEDGRRVSVRREAGRVVGWQDPVGGTVRVERGEDGRIRELQDAAGGRWRIGSDASGHFTEVTDPAGNPWRYAWDPAGMLTEIVAPDGRALRLGRDRAGRIEAVGRGTGSQRFVRDAAGRIVEVVHGTGAATRIGRDGSGRITSLEDPAGGRYVLSEHAAGVPGRIVGPSGETWSLLRDLCGRPVGLVPPEGTPITWERDVAGRVTTVRQGNARTRIYRQQDGRITQVVDAVGRVTGWAWDALGRLASWRQPDGSRLLLGRDPSGEIVSLQYGRETVVVHREAGGRFQSLDRPSGGVRRELLSVRRDLRGLVTEVRWDGGSVSLRRNGAGRLVGVTTRDEEVVVSLDARGLATALTGRGGSWRVSRDPDGLVTGLEGSDPGWRLDRDERGLPQALAMGDRRITWQHDASGRLAWVRTGARGGPDGGEAGETVGIGVQWGPGGRPDLLRFPGGVLLWLQRGPLSETWRYEGSDGVVLGSLVLGRDEVDRVRQRTDDRGLHVVRRSPLGPVVAVEEGDGAWSEAPGSVEGPAGELVSLDDRGRPSRVVPPLGPPVWGVSRTGVTYSVGTSGEIKVVEGDLGVAEVRFDSLGRLAGVEVHPRSGSEAPPADAAGLGVGRREALRYDVEYDAFGGLAAVRGPDGRTRYTSALGAILGWADDAGASTVCLEGPLGARVVVDGAGATAVLPDDLGSPVLFVGSAGVRRQSYAPTGFPREEDPFPLGARGGVQVFPGGPLLFSHGVLDPASGQFAGPRVVRLPWQTEAWSLDDQEGGDWPVVDGTGSVPWDPGPWGAEGVWADAFRLLAALGSEGLPGEEWTGGAAAPPAVPWLPVGVQRTVFPVPDGGGLPMHLDPVTEVILRAASRPAVPLETADLLRVLFEEDGARVPPPVPGLPLPAGLPAYSKSSVNLRVP